MTYNIRKTNGESLFGDAGLPENEIDVSTTSIALIGKLSPDYGNYQSENFVHLMEHFANDTFPVNPLKGQIVYNTNEDSLYMCTNDVLKTWTKVGGVQITKIDNPHTGDLFYNVDTKQLFIYDENINDYVLIGPINYEHKTNYSAYLETNIDMTSASEVINIDTNNASLITAKIVANEKMDISNPEYGIRMPESAIWIYKLMVQSYVLENGAINTSIIGDPSYELIGRTSGEALNWTITPSIINNKLQFTVSGVGTTYSLITSSMDSVKWELDIEVLKA
jgi:hypothetical protein